MNKQQFENTCASLSTAIYSMEIIANKMQFDTRFDEQISVALSPVMQKMNHMFANSLALIAAICSSVNTIKSRSKYKESFTALANNLGVLFAPVIVYLEQSLDIYAVCSIDGTACDLIDAFTKDMNKLHAFVYDTINNALTYETKELINHLREVEETNYIFGNKDESSDNYDDESDNADELPI